MSPDPQPKWTVDASGQWVCVLFIRDGKGDRPVNQPTATEMK
jgi:hypothetical protein